MVKFTAADLRRVMDHKDNIRNLSVIAHVDHGKSTLTDSLVAAAGMISQEDAGNVRATDTRADEAERGISIKSTGISLYYKMTDESLKDFIGDRDGNEYLFNLIDSPGHVDFSSEVTAALRLSDGALLVVDCIEGVCVQTATVIRQAIAERIRPVLVLNKMDRFFLELQVDGEAAYQMLRKVIEDVNVIISLNEGPGVMVFPENGTVVFSAGLHGWAFSLSNFAKMYATKYGIDESKILDRLWGEHYFDSATKKWTTMSTGSATCKRGFVLYVYEPVMQMISACMNDKDKLWPMLEKVGVNLKNEAKDLMGKLLMKRVMQTWLPASSALLELIIYHLPSPLTAQIYRVENLYSGPGDDEFANGIRYCSPDGPLMIYVSKMIPSSENGRFYAFGRVFSGTITHGTMVRIMGANFVFDGTKDLYKQQRVQRLCIWMGKRQVTVDDVPCGNTVALVGLDKFISKSATLTEERRVLAHPIREMKFSVSPVVRAAVECKVATDLPKLVAGLKQLSKSDPMVFCTIEESGEHIIAGAGELHLQTCFKDLQNDYMGGAEIMMSTPVVSYRETVLEKSAHTIMSKSPNRHNRLYMEARPLEEGLAEAIDRLGPNRVGVGDLALQFGWNKDLQSRIWSFGPDNTGPNMFVDMCKGVQYMKETRDSVVLGFQSVSKKGVLAEESMRNIRFDISGAMLHSDSIHRGGSQLISTAKRAMYASQLTAVPRLMEPVYSVEILAPENALRGISKVLTKRDGYVTQETQKPGTPLYIISGFLPVAKSFGFSADLKTATSAEAFPQCVFHGWNVLASDPLEAGSEANAIVKSIRRRKGLNEQVPPLSEFEDML